MAADVDKTVGARWSDRRADLPVYEAGARRIGCSRLSPWSALASIPSFRSRPIRSNHPTGASLGLGWRSGPRSWP